MDKALKKTFSFMDKLIEELDEKEDEKDNLKEDLTGGKTEESKTFKSMN